MADNYPKTTLLLCTHCTLDNFGICIVTSITPMFLANFASFILKIISKERIVYASASDNNCVALRAQLKPVYTQISKLSFKLVIYNSMPLHLYSA